LKVKKPVEGSQLAELRRDSISKRKRYPKPSGLTEGAKAEAFETLKIFQGK
jgi:hypothetical protein